MKNPFRKKSGVYGTVSRKSNAGISTDILLDYRKYAGLSDNEPICKAPFLSMRFNRNGGVTPCCQNYHLDSVCDKGILDVWNGKPYTDLRKRILENNLDGQCDFCKTHLLNRDFGNVLATHYKHFTIEERLKPVYLDFSIDSHCNLQCIMCNGSLSSGLANPEEKKATGVIYDERFFEELELLIPDLEFAIFSGGEPFMIESYYRIWDRMMTLNPSMSIVITTNATVLGERAKNIIERGNCSFNISLDSMDTLVYEHIRTNASFARTQENLQYLIDYTRRKGTNLTIAACPMNMNWQTLPELAEFCVKEKIQLYFNLVTKPFGVALWPLEDEKLLSIARYLKDCFLATEKPSSDGPFSQIQILIQQLESWAGQSAYFQKRLNYYLISEKAFKDQLISYLSTDPFFAAHSATEQEIISQKTEAVLSSLPESFFTDFFIRRVMRMPASRIITEILNEDIPTTAGNFCSIYYYSRGETYINNNDHTT